MAMADTQHLLLPAEILSTYQTVDPVFLNTPVMEITSINEVLMARVKMKMEIFNPIRSFKGRGTEALFESYKTCPTHVVTMSTGNFGQGVARAALKRHAQADIFVPEYANPLKVKAMRNLGATVHMVPSSEGEGTTHAKQFAYNTGATLIEDGKDKAITVGAAGIGLELSQTDNVSDILLLQLGDGALAAGVASWIKAYHPNTKIIGIVPAGAQAMAHSVRAGYVMLGTKINTMADGMGTLIPIATSVAQLRACLDDIVIVNDSAMVTAAKLLFDETGLLVEAAGVAGLAAIAARPDLFAGHSVSTIITGANYSPEFKACVMSS